MGPPLVRRVGTTAGSSRLGPNDWWTLLPGQRRSTPTADPAEKMATKEVVMGKVQRNQPCPCGSGSKAKRCCYGPEQIIEVRVMPLDLTEDAISVLRATSVIELRALFDQLFYLPELDLSLQVPLPGVITPEIDQAISALRDEDGERFDRALATVVPSVDTVDHRITLARATIALRDQGR